MSIFDAIGKAFSSKEKPPSVQALEKLLAQAEAHHADTIARVEALELKRADALLAGEGTRIAHRSELNSARDDAADAGVALDAVRSRLEAARMEAEEAVRRARYVAALKAQQRAAAELLEKYAPAIAELRRLQQLVADADALADIANASLPEGAERLVETESVRDVPAAPERILKAEPDSQWVTSATGAPVDAARVTRREGRRGVMYSPSPIGPRPIPCELVEIQRVTRQPWAPPIYGARLSDMALPDLKAEPAPPPAAVTEIVPLPPPVAVAAE